MIHKNLQPLMLALGGAALITLAGCASDSSSMETRSSDYVVTGLGDERQEAIGEAKERALEQCEAQDRDEFVIVEQQVLDPDASAAKRAKAGEMLEGATVNDETNLDAASADGDGYKAVWTIRCR
ncbi:hypothetical protein SAMN05661010_01803 [Modicisalibacter muralis]|uniref:DUF4156 domain-containing protein n=1 Tax=Modicisalibacter muralis TaxID=119000 RepID=A0A1G9KK50_9GAMM|nr:hypothetical protein [Halomonas muralis]SDL49775.1 hypothetical protein SAMN05661010_01803 [Halomonas muralis]